MAIASLGGIGIGFVWGWLVVLFYGRGRARRPYLNLFVAAAAAALVAVDVFTVTGWQTLMFFLGATVFVLCIHLGWLQSLRERASSSRTF